MPPEILRGAFRIAFLILAVALVSLPFQPAGSAEQVVTVMALVVGALFVGAIALLVRLDRTPVPDDTRRPKGDTARSTRRER